MKNLIYGISILICTSLWICYTESYHPASLLFLAISLFLILKGYFKIISDEHKTKKTD